MNNKKKYFIFIGLILIALIGVSFAFFNYYMQGANRELIAGDIYLNMDETGGFVTLTNVFPETVEEARARTDNTVTFTIDGRNTTTNKTIYYEIMLDEGDTNSNYTNKIKPEHLRFDLIEIIDGEETMVVDNKSYRELNSTRIYVNEVDPNTEEVERSYQLRVWVDGNILISDTDPIADYPASTWKDTYASVKVSVYGDFIFKEAATDASCFSYREVVDPSLYAFTSDEYELNTSEEGIASCKDFFLNNMSGGTDISDAQDGYQSFCEGTGTVTADGMTFDFNEFFDLVSDDFIIEDLASANIIIKPTRYYTLNTSEEAVASCQSYMLNDWEFAKLEGFAGQDFSGDGYWSFCNGTGGLYHFAYNLKVSLVTRNPYAGGRTITSGDVRYFVEHGILEEVINPISGIAITNYDAETCGVDVVIPSKIDDIDVIAVGEFGDLDDDLFAYKSIKSIVLPKTLKYIGRFAFSYNDITSIFIPESVTYIDNGAFKGNENLLNVEISDSVEVISLEAFAKCGNINYVDIKGNPALGLDSFSGTSIQSFKYGGTCGKLNKNTDIFGGDLPTSIITSDNDACVYTVND